MKNLISLHIPFTRLIFLTAWISILTSFMLINYTLWIIPIIAFSIALFAQHHRAYRVPCILSVIAIMITVLRITHIQHQHARDIVFLGKPLIIKGTIEKIQKNTQERSIVNVFIKTYSLYTQDAGNIKTQKLICLQIPICRSRYLKLGQRATFYKVILTQPSPTQNPEYHLYTIKEGIWASGFITQERFFVTSKRNIAWYFQVFEKLQQHFDNATSHLYNPLFLGQREKDQESLSIQHQSMYWGIAHHMARSGIHLAVLLGFVLMFFHYARIRHRMKFIICAMLVVAYAYISVASISFVRAVMMILLQMFSKAHGYMYSSIHAFALTLLTVVLYNPFQVMFLDFQLSFAVTGIIIWLFYIKWTKTIDFPLRNFIKS